MIFTAYSVYSVQAETVTYFCLAQDNGVQVTTGEFDLTSQYPHNNDWRSGQAEFSIPYTDYTFRLAVSGTSTGTKSFNLHSMDLRVSDPSDAARSVRGYSLAPGVRPFGQSYSMWLNSSETTAYCSFTIAQ